MNKRWLITIGVIVVVLIVIGILYDNGMLNFRWQGLTMVFAALAAPYTLLKNWLIKDRKTQTLINDHKDMLNKEKEHRKEYDEKIKLKEERIKLLNEEIKNSEQKVKEIEIKKKEVNKEVKEMSIEELQSEGVKYFGD